MKKLGLALGTGSARGWAHIGVVKSLQDAGINIDMVCGTSIGAMIGSALAGNFMSGLEKMALSLTWPDIIGFMDLLFPRSGFIEGDRIITYFRNNFSDADIEDLVIPFGAVATDIMTGREIWLQEGSLMDAVRASISMPGIFTPCRHKEYLLVDGGLVNPVPVSLCRAMGADIVIAVNLNSDLVGLPRYINRGKQKNKRNKSGEKESNVITTFLSKNLLPLKIRNRRRLLKSSHSIFDVIAASVNIVQDRMTKQRLAVDPPDLLISPRIS
ncbi:MAG TPA: patatin-like phospholipase family protein, partial [Smithellaceae bacterium]|nr:patatin-like phospholipase family protein [Smithellaceae bacterium]